MFSRQNSALAQVNNAQAAILLIVLCVVAGLAYFALSKPDSSAQTASGAGQPVGLQLPRAPSLLAAGGDSADIVSTVANAASPEKPNSLANTQPDGDWSIGQSGQPQPSMALRRRFDYFLLLQGEVDISALTAQIRQQVQAAHGGAAAQQIMAVWDSYLRLQQHAWTTQVNMQRPETWSPALAERSAVRRQLLGAAWAEAFYGDEENALRQMIAQASSGLPVTQAAQPNDPIALPDAAERIAAHEAQWQQWEQRLTAARSRIEQLRSAPELSASQRSEAITTYVNQQFSGSELVRAKALLNL
jgi:lipase chaperone LimK